MSDTIVRFDDVGKTFSAGKQTLTALDGVDLSVRRGEIFGVIGYSGAGKSTLVRLINGLERPTSGRIEVDGLDITGLSESRLRDVRSGIGMIFQQFNLLRSRTVAGNVAYPLVVAGWPRARRRERVAELLRFVGLEDKAAAYPDQLSGGQKQRVGIARALATSPALLLADESTSALDPETTQDVLRLLRKVNQELGITIVVITHEMDVVRSIADRVAVLAEGRVVELGTVFDVFSDPQTAASKSFVGTVLRSRPDTTDLDRLWQPESGRIVNAEVRDASRIGHVLSDAGSHGVRFEILYGSITTLQSRSFGNLTLELIGPADGVDRVLVSLREVTTVEEVIR
ncbi:methionine ABC transporter ATP-binding protein [Rhodococcus rhodnii]|uniref:D-methionine ABC transporter ATP-binding protein n=2 Tax=Rhodococcus rhodnii TaxID=38312 RepID=R7WGY1_9NOCA|nr:methionine ABC transporter ATP-binding protein [Rhodococcus rhodnii]EOM74282.1 D-methionine ABC transporter ATP-binding protein [Rhodococcus rhodnii LMG 5362]TXG89571.1 methionine ABC transporter ATP-binding protein [Rhodococcus rhodnii]